MCLGSFKQLIIFAENAFKLHVFFLEFLNNSLRKKIVMMRCYYNDDNIIKLKNRYNIVIIKMITLRFRDLSKAKNNMFHDMYVRALIINWLLIQLLWNCDQFQPFTTWVGYHYLMRYLESLPEIYLSSLISGIFISIN